MGAVACIGRIVDISDIEKADRLELATVMCGKNGKWRGVVPINEFSVGEIVEVYLPDAVVPPEPRFAFMEKRHWRVSQQRFRGAPSECLIVKPSPAVAERLDDLDIGSDIAEIVGAKKYNKPIPANSGDILGPFPSWVPKTDEPNMQSVPHIVEALTEQPYYITEKVDGMSGTCFLDCTTKPQSHFGCCTRNWEIKRSERAIVWQMAEKEKYGIERALYDATLKLGVDRIAIQFEIYGPKIQSNPLGVSTRQIAVFDVYVDGEYLGCEPLNVFCFTYDIPIVTMLSTGNEFRHSYDDLQNLCQKYKYPSGKPIEGIVVRSSTPRYVDGDRVSFKLINLLYKD